jgi:hypothetical protein
MKLEDLLDDYNASDYFDYIIKKFDLQPHYNIYQNEQNEVIIDEQWKTKDCDFIKANRIFKFDILFLDLIKEDSRLNVLTQVLELYVQSEDYENAALVRDFINIY